MADNVSVTGGSYTATVAADDIGGVHFQRTKTTWGPDGTANDVDVASGKPLPVQLRGSAGADVVKLIDGVVGATDPGVMALGIRTDSLSTLTEVEGDYTPARRDSIGATWVTLAHMPTVIGPDAHDVAKDANNRPVLVGGVATDAAPTAVGADGRLVQAWFDRLGRAQGVVTERGATGTPTYGQVTVDTTATGVVVKASNAKRRRIEVVNHGTTPVFLGYDTSLSASNGVLLPGVVGASRVFFGTAQVRGIVASGSQVVSYTEEVLA